MFFIQVLYSWFLCGLPLIAQEPPRILEWSEYPDIPDSIGFNGSFIGVHNNVLMIAGGANFPEQPVWEGGAKHWYSSIYVLRQNNNGSFYWYTDSDFRLPEPIAYGVSIETEKGLICIGGSNSDGVQNKIYRLSWDHQNQRVTNEQLPDLPKPLASMGGAKIGDVIYLAGGQEDANGSATKSFLSLDLSKENSPGFEWQELPPWPGPERINPVVAAQNNGQVDALYILSGRNYTPESQPPHQLLSDVYMYNPHSKIWTRKKDIPSNQTPGIEGGFIGAAPVVSYGGSHILIFGGAGGPYQYLMERSAIETEIRELTNQVHLNDYGLDSQELQQKNQKLTELVKSTSFSNAILAYHTITDSWVEIGALPTASQVVTTATIFNGSIVIPGGEIRPGVRTTKVLKGDFIPYTAEFGVVNYLTLAGYLCLIVWMGWYFSKRNKSTQDYFLGGKRVPWWAAGLSIYATMLSAITYLSQPALAYSFDWQAYLGYFTILMMAPVVIYFYLPYYRKLNITTAYEYLEQRFNLATRMFGSISFVLFQLARMGVVVYLPALALSTVIGMDIYTAIILMGILAILYTVLGGIEAVIWTDVLQVAVLLLGLLAGLFYVVIEMDGLINIVAAAYDDQKFQMFDWRWSTTEVVTWSLFLGSLALNVAPYTADQAVVQRYLTTSTEKEARKSIWLSGLLSIPAGVLIFSMGTFLYVYFKEYPELLQIGMENDRIFPLFIANQLPAGIAGLVIAGVFSASMSSLDSSMHSVSTVVSVDFYQRFYRKYNDQSSLSVARWVTVLVGILGTMVACIMAVFPVSSLFFLFQEIVGLFGSALAGVFMLGVFTRSTHGWGALIGAFLSVLTVAWAKYMTPINFYIYPLIGIPVCVLAGYMISKLWPLDQFRANHLS